MSIGARRSSWLELSPAAIVHNLGVFRALVGAGGLGVVMKADAYGHGLAALLPAVHGVVDVIYVIEPADALAVRAWEAAVGAARRPVLVLGVVVASEVTALAAADVEVVIGDDGWREWIAPLRAAGSALRAHVHVDTGLGREGFTPAQLAAGLAGLRDAARVLPVVGVMTHFADTEDVTEQAYALEQLRRFDLGTRELARVVGRADLIRHTAASAPALVLPASRMDVIRVGIAAYGLWPSRETRISARVVTGGSQRLEPVLAWRVGAQHLKELPAGSYVGYGCTWRCPHDTRVAVLPVGYYDGYPRAVSGRARVLVGGRRCPVLGRVMMNHLIVDVTEAEVSAGSVFTLIGRDGGEEVTADDLAGWAGTISYEIVARLGAHLPRLVVAEPAPAG